MSMPPAERFARTLKHFQSTDNALAIIGMDARGILGIATGQLRMQRGRTFLFKTGGQAGDDVRRYGRNFRYAVQQTLEIEPRAADQQRQLAARVNIAGGGNGQFRPATGADLAGRLQKTVQMVRSAGALLGRGLRGYQGEIRVHLPGVGIDDFAVEGLGKGQRRFRLAAAGGSGKTEYRYGLLRGHG